MASTVTVNELLMLLYSSEFVQSFEGIDLVVTTDQTESVDIADIAERYLGKGINNAISNVESKEEIIAFSVETPRTRVEGIAKGKWILFLAITLATLLLGADTVKAILRLIFGG